MTSKSFYPSTTSQQSTTSTTPLQASQRPPQKDYSAALATLQSRYGTAGFIPSPKKTPSKKLQSSPADARKNNTSSVFSSSEASVTTTMPSSTVSSLSSSSETSTSSDDKKERKSKKNKSLLRSLFNGKKSKDMDDSR